jgi:predicted DNA-binding transcriptional regulator YafY
MTGTSARLLRLLSLLQGRPEWTATELGGRLGVTTRTVRKDMQRLRELGYPVDGTAGVGGGYRLGTGADLPPLLLDDDEAVALAIALQTAAGGTVAGVEEPALRALTKLHRVLPSRLRHRVEAIAGTTSTVPPAPPLVDVSVLAGVAAAIRDRETLRFDYRRHDGSTGHREAEPHRLVHTGRRWYLLGWVPTREDWRTYRVDRMTVKVPNGRRFPPRDPPEGGYAHHVARGLSVSTWPVVGRFLLHAPIEQLRGRSHLADGMLEPVDDRTCRLTTGADSDAMLLVIVGIYDVDFTVLDPPTVIRRAAEMADRYRRAARAGGTESPAGPRS